MDYRMMRLAAAAAALTIAAPIAAQERRTESQERRSERGETFDWRGRVPRGGWLRIRNLNGSIEVSPADGDVAEVRGEKKWRRGDPEDVRFEVLRDGENITICAIWNDEDRCDDRGYRSRSRRDRHNDVSVQFAVRLPRGVKVLAGTVNGSVEVTGADAEVVASSVNGRVEATTTRGPVKASSVNGDLAVRMDDVGAAGDMHFSTVNGSITLELPSDFDADVDMSTVNGGLKSDYPMTVTGRIDPRRIRATIGNGGRRLSLNTVNGNVTLRRRGEGRE